VIGVAWVIVRRREGYRRRDAIIEGAMFTLAIAGALINRWATHESDQMNANLTTQLQTEQSQVTSLTLEVAPRHLRPQQVDAIVSAFRGSNDTVTVWRCISMESAIDLMNDFISAFQSAGLKFGPGGVSTQCGSGILVTFNPEDREMLARLEEAFSGAGIHVFGARSKGMRENSFSILVGSRTAQSP